MNKLKLFLLLTATLICPTAWAQVEMADGMRQEGKIYVLVAIILIVLTGLFVYLFLIDRKVKRLENLVREKEAQTK